jgi:hypothetical protein
MAAHTPVEDATIAGTKDAENTISGLRGEDAEIAREWEAKNGFESSNILETDTGIDLAGEAGATLTPALGVGALGTVVLGAGAAVLGVDIGNGLDQLFGIPEFHPFSGGEEAEVKFHGIVPEHKPEGFTVKERVSNSKGEFIEETEHKLPSGTYLNWEAESVRKKEITVHCGKTKPFGECSVSEHTVEACPELKCIPEPEKYQQDEVIIERGENEGFGVESVLVTRLYWYRPAEECNDSGLSEVEIFEGGGCLVPLGIPAAGLLTKGVEESNTAHGAPAHPMAPPLTLPTHPPDTVKEPEVGKITEIPPPRKRIEEGREHKKEQEEEEEHELVIPLFGDELATEYATKLEEEGFTNVHTYVVPEEDTNPERGPNQVARVSPEPGSRVSSGVRVDVGENPADAPVPEVRTPLGGPTLPGIKLPNIGLLCNTMPFGVPCWLVKQIEAFSGTGSAPIWKIGPFHWGSTTIPAAEVHLSAIEPVMEVIRPFMVLFGTIGIVLLFYRIFTGKSLGGGENPPGQVPDPEAPGPGNAFDDEYDTRGYGGGILG